MQDDPNSLLEFFRNLPPAAGGVIMAVFVSILRVVYDQEESRPLRIFLESAICGSLTLAGGSAAVAMGLGDGYHLFIGGMVGFLGSIKIRQLAFNIINRKAGK